MKTPQPRKRGICAALQQAGCGECEIHAAVCRRNFEMPPNAEMGLRTKSVILIVGLLGRLDHFLCHLGRNFVVMGKFHGVYPAAAGH